MFTDPLVPEVRACLVDADVSAPLRRTLLDPQVMKLLHGCSSDVLWLACNFDLFLAGVLDTYELAKAVGAPARSLAGLLKREFGVATDKSHQRGDWRIRPLSPAALVYARLDTRYLAPLAYKLASRLCPSAVTE